MPSSLSRKKSTTTPLALHFSKCDVDSTFLASLDYRTFLQRANLLYDLTCLAFAPTGPSTPALTSGVVKAINDVAGCAGALADPDDEPT